MNSLSQIGELAASVGIAPSAVRFYERQGLLEPEGRSEGNYRLYGEAARQRLRFIRAAQAAGFTLADIRALLELSDGSRAPCGEVQRLIEGRLTHVAEQMAQLGHVDAVLKRGLDVCHHAERSGECQVMDSLLMGAPPGGPGGGGEEISNE